MDRQRAIDVLIALACCTVPGLACDECPMCADVDETAPITGDEIIGCKPWTDDDVVDAVRFLKKEERDERQ